MAKKANGIIKLRTVKRYNDSDVYLMEVIGINDDLLYYEYSATKEKSIENAEYWNRNTDWPILDKGVI